MMILPSFSILFLQRMLECTRRCKSHGFLIGRYEDNFIFLQLPLDSGFILQDYLPIRPYKAQVVICKEDLHALARAGTRVNRLWYIIFEVDNYKTIIIPHVDIFIVCIILFFPFVEEYDDECPQFPIVELDNVLKDST